MLRLTISGDFAITPSILNEFKKIEIDKSLSHLLRNADFNITNLEAPIIDLPNPLSKYGPHLESNSEVLKILKKLNINIVTLANNHILDHSESGLFSTINYLQDFGIDFVGAGKNLASACKPLVLNKGDIQIGIINVAENEFSNTHGEYPGAAPLDIIENTLLIQSLKKEVDKVILIVHGGTELHQYPSPRFKKLLEYFVLQGADAVIAHHSHRYNGARIFNNVPIIYGTGNFIFPVKKSEDQWNIGVIGELIIQKDNPIEYNLHPVKLEYEHNLSIKLLEGRERKDFFAFDEGIKTILESDEKLNQEYEVFVSKLNKQYQHFLQPYTSKYFHKLFSMGVLPNFLKNKTKKLLYLNLVRCEAHRDVLIKLLSK